MARSSLARTMICSSEFSIRADSTTYTLSASVGRTIASECRMSATLVSLLFVLIAVQSPD
jgi:hypothetical protein